VVNSNSFRFLGAVLESGYVETIGSRLRNVHCSDQLRVRQVERGCREGSGKHFDAIGSHAREAVLAGYDDRFFTTVPREEWAKRLTTIESKVGEFQSYKVMNWNVNSKLGTDGGTYVTLTCAVTYSKYPAQERMVLFRKDDNAEFKILQHGVNSDAFLKE
jgi:hypothetical protein